MDIIREDFFHFLWEQLHFAQSVLSTTNGRKVEIIHPGYPHSGDGPDYRFARIRMDGLLFIGDIELHKKASEWRMHGHHMDSRYEKVILHVVIHDDMHRQNVRGSDGTGIPTLELRSTLPGNLAQLWRSFHQPETLPCSGFLSGIPEDHIQIITTRWDQYYFEYRLNRMKQYYPSHMPISAGWKQMLVRGVFEGLGYHRNQSCMVQLADALENEKKNGTDKDTLSWITDMLLKKSGLTNHPEAILRRHEWDFSASRPVNQPNSRIRQAAEIYLSLQKTLPGEWLEKSPEKIWTTICRLHHNPSPGRQRSRVILHNTILPSVYLLGKWLHKHPVCREVTRAWARQRIPLPPKTEKTLKSTGLPTGDHYHKLATLHHFKYFCKTKRCIECEVMKYLVQT